MTVIGYDFNADHYCDGVCILRALGEVTQDQYEQATYITDVTVLFDECSTVEGALAVIARRRGVDRMDERSYDSGSFPKVIFSTEEFPDYCPRCALCHGALPGFDPADYTAKEY